MPFNQSAAPRGSETILLVESDPETRKLAAFMLGKQGYTVLEAHNKTEAFALFNQQPGDVELLLLEARRGSCQLADEVKQCQPHVRVLFMCSDPGRGVPFLVGTQSQSMKKPFTMCELAGKVRTILDSHVENAIAAGNSFYV